MGLFNKKELTKIAELEAELEKMGALEYSEIQRLTEASKVEKTKIEAEAEEIIKKAKKEQSVIKDQCDKLNRQCQEQQQHLNEIMLDLEMSDFGLYQPSYTCMNSEEYAEKIKENREKQKKAIKNKTALAFSTNWQLDGSKSKGNAMNNDNMKMYLRAFNNECDVLISKVKFNNFDAIKAKIQKCVEALNKLNARNQITAQPAFIRLKLEELALVHEYNCKKQEEKESIREARAAEREQQKLEKELVAARIKIIKEQTHYENAKEKLLIQLATADASMIADLQSKLTEIDNQLSEISTNLADIDYREANQRAGYVYVISNIGSFGKDVYKIGMTRRLEPQDRVDELGDASVPFRFDVHAMIFSDDAPKLESALHAAFEKQKINLINGRKEFFHVSLEEIESVVKENHDKLVEFEKHADAEQYRESEKLKELHR